MEIFVLSDGKINETIENKNQTIIETNIQEYKAKTTMYSNHYMGKIAYKLIIGDILQWMLEILETTWNQTRNETFKVHEMEQLY